MKPIRNRVTKTTRLVDFSLEEIAALDKKGKMRVESEESNHRDDIEEMEVGVNFFVNDIDETKREIEDL